MPTATTTTPIRNSQPDMGSNNISNIPNPNPIKQTAMVFFSSFNIIITSSFVYYIWFYVVLLLSNILYKPKTKRTGTQNVC